ncbi:DUF2309 domain-containing protein [uncultured Roseibium sp.]|uniref:YbcC family protein n=1 Tax=uncultured Roseibium sp. TaxID=1936171 RepID=UPI0026145D6A|nr:DUF2309 domain-containing protein [uncultured Roseibium sp.]
MFIKHAQFTSARKSGILQAGETAIRAIPPAFPLDATVAVNPFLGQMNEDLAGASARLARVAGVNLTQPRKAHFDDIQTGRIGDEDLTAALDASYSPLKPGNLETLKDRASQRAREPRTASTIAELAATASGIDWPSVISRTFGLWASGHFDRGQALWTPAPDEGAFMAWRAWASRDLTPEIAGLSGFCSHVSAAPDTAEQAVLKTTDTLGLSIAAAETALHRLLIDVGGWAQHARWLLWQAELNGGTDATLADILAIRLIWEEALLTRFPEINDQWKEEISAHEAPLSASGDQVVDAILQEAAERAYQREIVSKLGTSNAGLKRPAVQAAFCIDVRSEVFRRALESQSAGIETIGFAGFFGLPLAHTDHGSDVVEHHLPVLLKPALTSTSQGDKKAEHKERVRRRVLRAFDRFRQAAVSSFAFVEAAGPLYGLKLVGNAIGMSGKKSGQSPVPHIDPDLGAETKVEIAASVLKAMSLTKGLAPTVLLVGHGAQMTNNPHKSAYHCGACGGYSGEVSARLLASLLNDPETRKGLPAKGIEVPSDTCFIAGLHDTTTDNVTLYLEDCGRSGTEVRSLEKWLEQAGAEARTERALRLPGAKAATIASRAMDWSQIRPEWGLAGCAAFVAAPRYVSATADLEGRAFLHSYDWQTDEDFKTLELILTAPVVVASWISLQYYGSSVAPKVFGGGNKLIHNAVGGVGVVEGNGGNLRPGLPWQTLHDGKALVHKPLRLSVLIEAPQEAISAILQAHPEVETLFDNGWLHLFAMKEGSVVNRYRPGGAWSGEEHLKRAA